MSSQPPRRLVPLCEKIGEARIADVVHAFYGKLRADPEVSGFFAHIDDFSSHEERIVEFWWTAMGGRPRRADLTIDMPGRHDPLQLTPAAFERWLALFRQTLDEQLPKELADQWHFMAQGIAGRLRQHLGV